MFEENFFILFMYKYVSVQRVFVDFKRNKKMFKIISVFFFLFHFIKYLKFIK